MLRGDQYLVSHGDEYGQQEHVTVPRELLLDVLLRQGDEVPHHAGQERDRDHEVVAVGFDEVVAGDRRGVDVMFAEWT